MPYVDNNGTKIHYTTAGSGSSAVVLHHGFSQSGSDWSEFGYTELLQGSHRIILIDARGHGRSDKPHDPAAYSIELRVSDVIAVLDHLAIETTSYFGYSMGGWIGFALARHAKSRLRSVIIGGSHPGARSMSHQRDALRKGIEGGHDAFLSAMADLYGPNPRRDSRSNDLEALLALSQDRPSLEDALAHMTMPSLFFAGESDPSHAAVARCARQVRTARFVSLPGLGHVDAFNRADLVVPHVLDFLQSVDSSPSNSREPT